MRRMVLCAADSAIETGGVGLIIGVASGVLSVLVLFSIKPSLRLTWEEGIRSKTWWKHPLQYETWRTGNGSEQPHDEDWLCCSNSQRREGKRALGKCPMCGRSTVHYRIEIENLGLAKVLEIEPRLLLVRRQRRALATREWIPLEAEKLLELNGKWHEARRGRYELDERIGDSFYHFFMPCAVSSDQLGPDDYYLIQVWARHGFTNFGRVHKLRIRKNAHPDQFGFDAFRIEGSDGQRHLRLFGPATTLVTSIFASRAAREATDVKRGRA
jgi:hypothetical protein